MTSFKILQQKIQDMKKEIELTTFNNSNLSKLLTKKNIDFIEYQKREIIKWKNFTKNF